MINEREGDGVTHIL